MKGYNVHFEQFVGCSHCRNTWYEKCSYNVGMSVINSASYKYNACDRCFDAEKQQYRPEYQSNQDPRAQAIIDSLGGLR